MSEDRTPDEPDSTDDGDQPMNRAERRAKAKGKKTAQASFPGKQGFAPKGAGAHNQRMWSNRRSGG
jgi:hypothetical protein